MNTNIRHKSKLFHVQTEDSGMQHPHIITHLFSEGAIVATRKTSYQEYVSAPNVKEVVRKMMKESHREMLIALRDGQFDGSGPPHVEVDIPIEIDAAGPMEPAIPLTQRAARPASVAPASASVPPRVGKSSMPPPGTRSTTPSRMNQPPPQVVAHPVAPPSDTTYKQTRVPTEKVAVERRAIVDVSASRYAETQPVQPASAPHPPSIFGGDAVSEKSLDEVILSYLSEDVTEE